MCVCVWGGEGGVYGRCHWSLMLGRRVGKASWVFGGREGGLVKTSWGILGGGVGKTLWVSDNRGGWWVKHLMTWL